LACDGSRGNDEGPRGVGILQAPSERNAGDGFAYGDGVNPNGARTIRWKFIEARKRKSQAFAKIGQIFVAAQTLHQPVWREQKGGQAHQNAVNEIH